MMSVPSRAYHDALVVSDAPGNWGCGAYNTKGGVVPVLVAWESVHITIKEHLPIVFSCAIWGGGDAKWKGKTTGL